MRLNRTRGSRFHHFFLLSGLHHPEGLSGNTIAEHMMQQPRRQKATSNSQVVSITSKIPVLHTVPQLALEGDLSNSPISCLSHYLYHSDFTAAFSNKQCLALAYYCILY